MHHLHHTARLTLPLLLAGLTASCATPSADSTFEDAQIEYTDSDGYAYRIELTGASIGLYPDLEHSKPGEGMIPYELNVEGTVENLTPDRTASVRFAGAQAIPVWLSDSPACLAIDTNADWNALSDLIDTETYCAPLGNPGVDLRWQPSTFAKDEAKPGQAVGLSGDLDGRESRAVIYAEADFEDALQALEQPERWILVE
jgi:hypothetical protein